MTANAAALPQSSGDRLLEELVAVYPYSSGYTMTSTPDGNYLYAGEGCAVAVIHSDPTDLNADDNYNIPIKRDPVGRTGVLPVKLLLDPDVATTPVYGDDDLLYIAGGRDGLWAMQADTQNDTQPNLAVRIDDAKVETSTADQDSRRWCNDLDYITLEEGGEQVTYLVALFGQKNGSRLRLYNLDLVRSTVNLALGAGEETGHEINPQKSIGLPKHASMDAAGNGPSFAFGMDADEVNAAIYVAMGFHGLVRVKLDLPNNPPIQPWSLTWGPFFGDASYYATLDSDLYQNVKFYEGAELVTDYPPPFLDVAVDRTDPEDPWLYAAVDHLGLVGFSLSGAWNDHIHDGANPYVKRFHQEGVKDGSPALSWSELVDETEVLRCSTFARRVQVIESAKALVVSTLPIPTLRHPAVLTMSRTMSFDQMRVGPISGEATWTQFTPPPTGWVRHGYTLAYDLEQRDTWQSGERNTAARANMGRQMYGPPIQASSTLSFFAGGEYEVSRLLDPDRGAAVNQLDLYRVEFDGWPPTPPAVLTNYSQLVRYKEYRAGRWVYRAALNAANPQVLTTTNNEGGLIPTAPLVLDLTQPGGAKIVANFDPGPDDDPPPRKPYRIDGTNGIVFEPDAAHAKDNPSGPGKLEYRFGMRRWNPGTPPMEMRWRLARMLGGTNVTDPPNATAPYEQKEIFFTAPPDQFLSTGYYQYAGAGYSPDYYADTGKNYLFASVFQSPQGIRVLDFDQLIAKMDDDDDTSDGENNDLADQDWNAAMVGEFTTHPEYWNVEECRRNLTPDPDALDFVGRGTAFDGKVRTMPPQFIELPKDGHGHPADTWVLAVPCCYAGCDETADPFPNHPGWIPELDFQTGHGYSRLMVRFFDISDHTLINDDATQTQVGSYKMPTYTLLGPDECSSAMFLRTLHLDLEGNNDRYFCFVADLGGHMYVYEITDLLTLPPDFSPGGIKSHIHYGATIGPDATYPNTLLPFATYDPPDCLADDQISNIWDLEVDTAHWVDGELIEHDEVYVYVSVQREGVQVLRFDVSGTSDETRLVPLQLIQTPGETAFLYLCNVPQALENTDVGDYVTDKLLFVGDAIAGFRIYTYKFESQ